MGFRKAPGSEAGSSKSWSDEKGLVRGMRHQHQRSTSQSSNYGGLLFSRLRPDNVLCAGVDDSDDELESRQRSLAIDRYLESQHQERGRRLDVMAIGSCEQRRILWKQMRLRARPLGQGEQSVLAGDVRRLVLRLATQCLERGLARLEGLDDLGGTLDDDLVVSFRESLEYMASCKKKDEATTAELILQMGESTDLQAQFSTHKIDFLEVQRQVLEVDCSSFLSCACTHSHDIFQVLRRVFASGYEPTEHDWFHFDQSRNGSSVQEATVAGSERALNFLDVSLQSERKKWIHFFEGLAALVYVADPSRYTVKLEGGSMALDESVLEFESIVNSQLFKGIAIVLVLSNTAEFERKLRARPLAKVYPQYAGTTSEAALDFIADRYRSENQSGKEIHVFRSRTNGVDNQHGFLELLETTISSQQAADATKRKNKLTFLSP